MSCPHVAGIAALIRGAHPTWTPAAIKSALMRSSVLLDIRKSPIRDSFTGLTANAFAMGAGHVNPNAALDPGLIYDLGMDDYISFLCSLNYTAKQIHILTRNATSCPKLSSAPGDLNYPSFSVVFNPRSLVCVTSRSVTNVGGAPCEYEVAVESPGNVNITVEPRTLAFGKQNEKATYTATFESRIAADHKPKGRQAFGQILWKCVKGGTQVVRSPVAITWNYREE